MGAGRSVAAAALVAAALSAAPGPGTADTATSCAGAPVAVQGGTAALRERACRAAEGAMALLDTCGLAPAGTVRIDIVADFEAAPDHCVAQYDCGANRIEILPPERIAAELTPSSGFGRLPPDILFDSYLAHELAHAAANAAVAGPEIGRTAQEYLGYAMQLAALPPDVRAMLIGDRTMPDPMPPSWINPVILGMDPAVFASRAYLHFSAPGHGCDFVRGLLSGTEAFPALPDF